MRYRPLDGGTSVSGDTSSVSFSNALWVLVAIDVDTKGTHQAAVTIGNLPSVRIGLGAQIGASATTLELGIDGNTSQPGTWDVRYDSLTCDVTR